MGEYWRKFIENRHSSSKLSASTSEQIPYIILGNKSDLPSILSQEEIEKFVSKSQSEERDVPFVIKYLKTSAKSGLNVTEAFEELGLTIRAFIDQYKIKYMSKQQLVFNYDEVTNVEISSGD